MASQEAQMWAYFIVEKLGLPYTKAEIIRCVDDAGISATWNRFIASNSTYLEVAKANRIEGPSDVERFFRDASYASMRKTFPPKSHGRTVIGPRIVSLQKLKEQEVAEKTEREKYKLSLSELAELNAAVGKSIVHSADNGLSYGKGIVVGVNEENGAILVDFEGGIRRGFSYRYCLDNDIIRFV